MATRRWRRFGTLSLLVAAVVPVASCDSSGGSPLFGLNACLTRSQAMQVLDDADRDVHSLERPVCFDSGRFAGTTGELDSDSTSETIFVFERTKSGWEPVSWGNHGGFCLELLDADVPLDQLADAVPFAKYCEEVAADQ